jgi:hypothetical protein
MDLQFPYLPPKHALSPEAKIALEKLSDDWFKNFSKITRMLLVFRCLSHPEITKSNIANALANAVSRHLGWLDFDEVEFAVQDGLARVNWKCPLLAARNC